MPAIVRCGILQSAYPLVVDANTACRRCSSGTAAGPASATRLAGAFPLVAVNASLSWASLPRAAVIGTRVTVLKCGQCRQGSA